MTMIERVDLPDAVWFQEGPGLRKWQFTTSGIKILNVGNTMPDGSIDLSCTDRHISNEEFHQG
jgi:type I restriction enzyme S subunit